MDLFYVLLVLLVTTRAFGELAVRIGQPSLVGELVSGILLGTLAVHYQDLFPEIVALQHNDVFQAITDLGMFFIMLFAGIEMQPSKMISHSAGAAMTAVGGMVLPLALGLGLGWVFLPESDWLLAQSLFLGTALAITAVPATVRILMDLGKLNSRSGQIIVSAAVFDDILSLLLLAWLTGLIAAGGTPSGEALVILSLKIVVFFIISLVVGHFAYPWGGRLLKHVKEKELDFSVLLIAALAFAVLAEALALHFILGAFVAGVFFGRKTIDRRTYDSVRAKVSGMTFGFLGPLFFASVGLNLDMSAVTEIPVFLVVFLVVAFFGKFVGAGGAAYMVGLSGRESAAVGVGMSARGAVELVIADIAFRAGLFHLDGVVSPVLEHMFSAVVIMAVVTTLATPVLLKLIYQGEKKVNYWQ